MPMFVCSLSWTDQGIRNVKDAPKRAAHSREIAKKMGVTVKEIYLTSGSDDLLVIVDTPNGDNVAKWALALSSRICAHADVPGLAGSRVHEADLRVAVTRRGAPGFERDVSG
jgi:uncharacterized protein with GYD domain